VGGLFDCAGSLITGHEKGSIVVWHGLTQFYLSAMSQAVRTRKAAAAASASGVTEESSKSGKKHKKDKVNLCAAYTTGTQYIVLVLLVSCVVICFVGASRFAYFWWMSRCLPPFVRYLLYRRSTRRSTRCWNTRPPSRHSAPRCTGTPMQVLLYCFFAVVAHTVATIVHFERSC
jgi:hypothetical protein